MKMIRHTSAIGKRYAHMSGGADGGERGIQFV